MDAIDGLIMKQIREALAEAQQNREQAMAQANYWKGREDALLALLKPPKQESLPKGEKE